MRVVVHEFRQAVLGDVQVVRVASHGDLECLDGLGLLAARDAPPGRCLGRIQGGVLDRREARTAVPR